jgi:hypothetical protein
MRHLFTLGIFTRLALPITPARRRGGWAHAPLWGRSLASLVALAMSVVALAAPTGAFALSEGRVYERVSPLYKAGYGATIFAVAPDGESVVFDSLGAFNGEPQTAESGNNYLARRVAGREWETSPLQAPFPRPDNVESIDFSSTMEYAEAASTVGETRNEVQLLLHRVGAPDTPAEWSEPLGVPMKPIESRPIFAVPLGGSGDLCHVLIEGIALLPESGHRHTPFDLARGCHGEGPSLRLIGVRNSNGPSGEPAPIDEECTQVGQYGVGAVQGAHFFAFSGDGSEIFFTDEVVPGPSCGEGSVTADRQLFVRLGGSRTVEVSRPVEPSLPFGGCGEGGGAGEVPGEVPCPGAASRAPAFFKGASEDGSRVFFTSGATLVPGDTDTSSKLYMASIGCPVSEPGCEPAHRQVTGLADVSRSPLAGEDADVQGVVSMGRGAQYVYFVAHGVLSTTSNGDGAVAVKGADNLYVYNHSTKTIVFVGDLCSGPRVSGSHEATGCPSSGSGNDQGLWTNQGQSQSQSSPDGRFLLFGSFARLIRHGTQADVNEAQDLYRYDAETGVLDRVSLGEDGYGANGNATVSGATLANTIGILPTAESVYKEYSLATRAITDDGARIVFSSTSPLSAGAVNTGRENVYVWHKEPGWGEGRVSLISSGTSTSNDFNPVISVDGVDVFFMTSQGLVAGDTEEDVDVYDARIGGGFPQKGAEREPCSSDACQGPLTNPAPLLIPGSVSQASGGNFEVAGAGRPVAKAKSKPKAARKRKRKGKRVSGPGRGHRSVARRGR